ncbi:PTS sugar transporter subunit IIC [Tepidimicrobium xylanilyticum]|uniref:Permease IIC component n=1 Tax=Tepidimicrobium xylanilyticum TaxID=1123352 RepID=A0A1H2QBR6_9FIRM|nr:PTS transporter subunit EIIC [Tepidimicrobium xylanilyticum]SDW04673.1 PTS system, cellobiose-specific IIC component [Tepidimicrobium xylanilyticum]
MSNQNSKFSKIVEDRLLPVSTKISEQKHLKAIMSGLMSTIPLTIIGGISLIIASPPVDPEMIKPTNFFNKFLLAWYNWAKTNTEVVLTPFKMTMAIMALFVAFAIGYSLGKHYEEEYGTNPLASGIIAGVVFLLVAAPSKDGMIPTTYLDAKGLFTAMIVGLITVEITKGLLKKGITIKMPEGVPPAVAASFSGLIPMIINVILFYAINLILIGTVGKNIPETIMSVLTPALKGADTIWFVLIMTMLRHLLWSIGVHGAALNPIVTPVFMSNILANAAAKAAGESLPHIFTEPLWAFSGHLGGSGATLGLTLLMLRSKSSHLKTVGKLGILPGLFNINEPVLFGAPIILNPILMIPLITAPMVNNLICYTAMKVGLIEKVFVQAPWTTPAPLGLALSTMDWKAFVLVVLLIVIDMIIYYPFFKSYEKKLLEEEKGGESIA